MSQTNSSLYMWDFSVTQVSNVGSHLWGGACVVYLSQYQIAAVFEFARVESKEGPYGLLLSYCNKALVQIPVSFLLSFQGIKCLNGLGSPVSSHSHIRYLIG